MTARILKVLDAIDRLRVAENLTYEEAADRLVEIEKAKQAKREKAAKRKEERTAGRFRI